VFELNYGFFSGFKGQIKENRIFTINADIARPDFKPHSDKLCNLIGGSSILFNLFIRKLMSTTLNAELRSRLDTKTNSSFLETVWVGDS
jgi:hypothetical protein